MGRYGDTNKKKEIINYYCFMFDTFLASSMSGHTLNITHINREHMGAYRCMADNGIPPQANQTFHVEVHCK